MGLWRTAGPFRPVWFGKLKTGSVATEPFFFRRFSFGGRCVFPRQFPHRVHFLDNRKQGYPFQKKVIGGLVSATALTLILLQLLFCCLFYTISLDSRVPSVSELRRSKERSVGPLEGAGLARKYEDAPGPRDSWTEGTPHFHSGRCYEGALSMGRLGGRTLAYR
jgi:hypothetical protein